MIIQVQDFKPEIIADIPLMKRGRGNPATTRKIKYKNIVCAFDIETTALPEIEQSFMYIWQFQFGKDITIIGHYWSEFLAMLKELTIFMQDNVYLVIFVHNLSYEFSYLKGVYPFNEHEVFCIDSRKVLKCEMLQHFEFRCSYLHSNMKLETFVSKMGAEHQKLSGEEFDYSIKRYPWTPLSERELEYCVNDVRGLVEAVYNEMEHDNDNLYTYPLTSTGYVRRDVKRVMRGVSHNWLKELQPDEHVYTLLREAFRGGNTHANRYYTGIILDNVSSADESSAYPNAAINDQLPVKEFKRAHKPDQDWVDYLLNVRKKALLMRVRLTDVKLQNKFWGCPYLPQAKSRHIKGAIYDNGRILEADSLEITITDIDYKIICSEYHFNIEYLEVYYSSYGYLPDVLRDLIKQYYTDKTQLKNVKGQELFYDKQKAKLNSIYGCMVQDPVKQSILFKNGAFILDDKSTAELLEKAQKRAFLFYAWGVWITAHARFRLEQGIQKAGNNFVYCDTDSVKYLGAVDWSDYNNKQIKQSEDSGAVATDPKGNAHYMGVFEFEGTYDKFVTLGAKKYAYEENGRLHITIAGVNKKKGAKEMQEKGGITQFKEGFIFREGGGTEAVYNDNVSIDYKVDGRVIHITDNLHIKNSTYTLTVTPEYGNLIEWAQKLIQKQVWRPEY